ncbi:MAG: leucyl aminopeptidase [Bacteroidales bacterium]|nr:leucyl aminopeptidase [Bacteroidales bacterium]MCF8403201.1 leucyl aminopeptidase [Bacteroidales bacterium]
MQTIIHKTSAYSDTDNLVLVLTEIKNMKSGLFSEQELDYMKEYHSKHKKNFFSFNRMVNWVFVVFVEKESEKSTRLESYRLEGSKLQSIANGHKLNSLVVADLENKPEEILAFAEGIALKNYQFLKYKSKAVEKLNSLNAIYLFSENLGNDLVDVMNIIIDSTSQCRNLVNEPVAFLNAVQFSQEMGSLAQQSGCKVEVLNKKKIESLKMGGLLAVNKGSVDPPTFTIMEWKPENAQNNKPYVFVGKGVVYDTGGMNIKTGSSMNDMKMDMAGGAAVASTLYAISRAKLPVHVIGLIPATDNRTHGNAYVNGDIISMHDGTKVEVINTDAEGRMLLADALSYAKKYNPELVIDVATLTGSAMRAIGTYGIVAMQCKAVNEFKKLAKSGENVYERLVEFPMWKEYREDLNSDIADIKHLGGANAGAITAAKFLEHFTDYPYIHLDIAGPAYFEKTTKYYPTGGSGVAVRLLFNFIWNKVAGN